MAECYTSQCAKKRILFRKELQRWNKDVLLLVGLERIAEEIVGHENWRKLMTPFNDLENTNPEDWSPEEMCCFCCAKKQPPYDPADGIVHSIEASKEEKGTLKSDLEKGNLCQTNNFHMHCWSDGSVGGSRSPSPCGEEPLDLSVHSNRIFKTTEKEEEEDSNSASSVLKVPLPSSKLGQKRRLDTGYKRAYTEDELQAALRDIQTGKLGTRRAAVIYGIPRSTLRNKVYKLTLERKNKHKGTSLKADKIKQSFIDDIQPKKTEDDSSDVGSESLRQLLKMTITHKTQKTKTISPSEQNKISEPSNMWPFISPDFYTSDHLSIHRLVNSLEYSHAVAPLISQMLAGIEALALKKPTCGHSMLDQSLTDISQLPVLPHLIHHLAEERLLVECDRSKQLNEGTSKQENEMSECLSNVILKVPSFRPGSQTNLNKSGTTSALSSSHLGSKGISVSLKELIAKSITQRVGKSDVCVSKEDTLINSQVVGKEEKVWNNLKSRLILKSASQDSCPNSSQVGELPKKERKQIRPKRGRYRNYDHNSLTLAVRAVQSGEMSVHRAGTYYGVPHSTLEYKVKERHLLRTKKKINYPQKSSESWTSPKNSDSNQSLKKLSGGTNAKGNELTVSPGKLEDSPSQQISLPSQISLWQTMPFFSVDFPGLNSSSGNFFASQMMRKLQANAQRQEGDRGEQQQEVGILENLIKKTLEKSVSLEEKSTSSLIFSSTKESDTNIKRK
ncbi:mushroom body large-type Kenyon cell-specific protein 1-like isoform X1 [Tachypleus tridentatus]|uniref:mushroom body large-type Kenyon cell-specific protein 1-like isoform X1 n=2 Tax=Tachypleus tridentatus TaxID=6853 RepID=UPI003FD4E046